MEEKGIVNLSLPCLKAAERCNHMALITETMLMNADRINAASNLPSAPLIKSASR